MTVLWTFAVAQIGGVLIGLALRFPGRMGAHQETVRCLRSCLFWSRAGWRPGQLLRRPIVSDPWAYLPARQASYRFAALGILLFLAVILYRARKGSTLCCAPAGTSRVGRQCDCFSPDHDLACGTGIRRHAVFDPAVFLPSLLLFPIAVGLAILRYRLWEVDNIVNQAFVYGLLTAILAGVFAAMIGFTQRLFLAVTGEQSDIAIVLTTLIVAAAFTPVKTRVEEFVAHQFRDAHEETRDLRTVWRPGASLCPNERRDPDYSQAADGSRAHTTSRIRRPELARRGPPGSGAYGRSLEKRRRA